MPLTSFGLICRQHRIRMRKVMADQSNDMGVPASFISQIERGAVSVPDDYVGRLADWMQLDRLEALQLKNLSRLPPKWPKKRDATAGPKDLKGILNHLVVEKNPSGISNDQGTTS